MFGEPAETRTDYDPKFLLWLLGVIFLAIAVGALALAGIGGWTVAGILGITGSARVFASIGLGLSLVLAVLAGVWAIIVVPLWAFALTSRLVGWCYDVWESRVVGEMEWK